MVEQRRRERDRVALARRGRTGVRDVDRVVEQLVEVGRAPAGLLVPAGAGREAVVAGRDVVEVTGVGRGIVRERVDQRRVEADAGPPGARVVVVPDDGRGRPDRRGKARAADAAPLGAAEPEERPDVRVRGDVGLGPAGAAARRARRVCAADPGLPRRPRLAVVAAAARSRSSRSPTTCCRSRRCSARAADRDDVLAVRRAGAADRRAVVTGREVERLSRRRSVLENVVHVRVGGAAVAAPAVRDDLDARDSARLEHVLERPVRVVVPSQ